MATLENWKDRIAEALGLGSLANAWNEVEADWYSFIGSSGNANDGSKALRRMEFGFKGMNYKFLLNPDSYEQSEPARMNITQTKGGAFIEAFGAGIIEITMSGTTGFKNTSEQAESGYLKFKELRDLIKSVYDDVEDGSEINEYLYFYNFTDNEYFITYPDKFELSRSKSQPLLYKYSIHLYCIRRMGDPEPDTSVTIIGNPLGVESTYETTLTGSNPATTTNTGG